MIITENVDDISADLYELDDCTKLFAEAIRFAVGSLPAFARMAGGWLRFAISPLGPQGPLHGPA